MKHQQKYISNSLIIIINKIKKEQTIENLIKKGKKAKVVSFIEASEILARRFRK